MQLDWRSNYSNIGPFALFLNVFFVSLVVNNSLYYVFAYLVSDSDHFVLDFDVSHRVFKVLIMLNIISFGRYMFANTIIFIIYIIFFLKLRHKENAVVAYQFCISLLASMLYKFSNKIQVSSESRRALGLNQSTLEPKLIMRLLYVCFLTYI